MALTILAIPLLVMGVSTSTYTMQGQCRFAIGFAHNNGYCFEQDSQIPETIKYGLVAAGFVVLCRPVADPAATGREIRKPPRLGGGREVA